MTMSLSFVLENALVYSLSTISIGLNDTIIL